MRKEENGLRRLLRMYSESSLILRILIGLSMETALNSSGDVIFTATAEYRYWKKSGKSLPYFLGGDMKVDI